MKEKVLRRKGIRRILSFVLCFVMCLSLMPVTAFAADVETYNVWANGEQFTNNNLTISCGDGTATYDPATNTVTLNGAQITKASEEGAVRAKGALTVNVVGDSSITLDGSTLAHGIFADGNLTLTGSGNLDIRIEGAYDGIETINGNVAISGRGDVTVNANQHGVYIGEGYLNISGSGDVDIHGKYNGAYGEDIQVLLNGTGGSVTLSGGYRAFNDEDEESIVAGFNVNDYDVSGSPDSTKVVYTYKIVVPYDVWVNGEQFTSKQMTIACGSGTATYDPANNTLTLDGAQITKAINYKNLVIGGICSVEPLVVNVVGDSNIDLDASTLGYGIDVNGDLTLTGAKKMEIHVEEEDAGCIYLNGGDLSVNMEGDLTLEAGGFGIYAYNGGIAISGSGDVTIDSNRNAMEASKNVSISGNGNVNLTARKYGKGISAAEKVIVSGIGDVTIVSEDTAIGAGDSVIISGNGNVNLTTNGSNGTGISAYENGVTLANKGKLTITVNEHTYGIYSHGNVTFSGSGEISIVAGRHGILLWNPEDKVLLNGTGSPISIKGSRDDYAIFNYQTGESPVAGTNFDKYEMPGRLNATSIVFTLKFECIATGNHDFSKCVSNGDGTHKVMCTVCDTVKEGHDKDACSGGKATCTKKAKCTECGKEYGKLAEHTLKTTTTKATLTTDGKKETKCTVCGKVTKTTKIYAAKTIKLSKTTYTYDDKAKKPTVTIKDSKGKAIATSNYTVKYDDGRKNVGKYNVKITLKGDYKGSKTLTFTINPKATTLKSVTPASKAFTATWTKQTTQVDGYELEYALDDKFTSSAKKVAVTKNTTTSKKISSLKSKKTYYVRVRTYKKVGTKKYYSDWSKVLSVKTK